MTLAARMPRRAAFVVAAAALVLAFAGAGSPIPLYNTWHEQNGISTSALATAAVSYFVAAAFALLVLGRLSDHLGRRAVGIAAMLLMASGCLVLATVDGMAPFLIGRLLQGLALGLASTALGAYVVDLAPERPAWLAPAVTASAPMLGVPIGALTSGVLVQVAPAPRVLVFVVFAVVFVVLAVLLALCTETVSRRPGAVGSLVPRVRIPAGTGRLVVSAGGIVVGTWSFGGFYQAFGPTVAAEYLGTTNTVVAAVVFTSIMILVPLGGPISGRLGTRPAIWIGAALFAVGACSAIASLSAGLIAPFLIASWAAGIGQGIASTGANRALLGRAAPDERAGLLAALYLISYCGAALPGLVAGGAAATATVGEIGVGYAALAVVGVTIGAVSTAFWARGGRRPGAGAADL